MDQEHMGSGQIPNLEISEEQQKLDAYNHWLINNEINSARKFGGLLASNALNQVNQKRFNLKIESERFNLNVLGISLLTSVSFINQAMSELKSSMIITIELAPEENSQKVETDGQANA